MGPRADVHFRPGVETSIALVQIGYLFPKTPWEIAARWSYYQREIGSGGPIDAGSARPQTHEIGAGLNYYLNGHGNKIQIDFSYYAADADGASGAGYYDAYTGVPLGFASGGNHFLVRFQWQLAL